MKRVLITGAGSYVGESVRMAPKARQAKQKARIGAYEKMASADSKEKEAALEIFIPNGPRLGNQVIEFHNVSKAYGDKLLFENLDFVLPPAGIVGVIGPNGAGKTTLFRLIMGLEAPDNGSIVIGDTVKLSYVDQQHKSIDPEKTVYQTIANDSDFVKLGNREMAGISQSTYFKLQHDQPVSTQMLVRICCALDCELWDIAELVEKKDRL